MQLRLVRCFPHIQLVKCKQLKTHTHKKKRTERETKFVKIWLRNLCSNLPATFFAGINFPVRDIYANPALRKCFCNFLFDFGMPCLSRRSNSAADGVAMLLFNI